MTQPTLFDVQNHDGHESFVYRKSDPATSQQAAAKVAPKLGGMRAKFVEGVRLCGGSATAAEAAAAITTNYSERDSIRKRAAECVRESAVKLTGSRTCKITGNECSVYEVV